MTVSPRPDILCWAGLLAPTGWLAGGWWLADQLSTGRLREEGEVGVEVRPAVPMITPATMVILRTGWIF